MQTMIDVSSSHHISNPEHRHSTATATAATHVHVGPFRSPKTSVSAAAPQVILTAVEDPPWLTSAGVNGNGNGTSSSRPRPRRGKTLPATPVDTTLSHEAFYRDQVCLRKYKVSELKLLAKHHRLRITGNKPTLIGRIETHFRETVVAIRLQSVARGHAVRRAWRLRGPALAWRRRNLCTNDTDFYQLEPIAEISPPEFFSYRDSEGFVYGFHLHSLMMNYHKKAIVIHPYNRGRMFDLNAVTNPYNRRPFDPDVVRDMFAAYRYVRTLFPAYRMENDHFFRELYLDFRVAYRCYQRHQAERTAAMETVVVGVQRGVEDGSSETSAWPPRRARSPSTVVRGNNSDLDSDTGSHPDNDHDGDLGVGSPSPPRVSSAQAPIPLPTSSAASVIEATRRRLLEMRELPLATRIRQLFIEFDQLGNYTSSEWFTNLTRRECFLLYQQLQQQWRVRGRIPSNIKMRMCPLGDPCYRALPTHARPSEIATEVLVDGCLWVMEQMVFSGIDDEYRKLGAFHVLTALTVVSLPARNSLMWLYESIVG